MKNQPRPYIMPHINLFFVRVSALGQLNVTRGPLILSASMIDIRRCFSLGVFDQVDLVYINCLMSMVYLVIGQTVAQLQGTKPTENNLHNEH